MTHHKEKAHEEMHKVHKELHKHHMHEAKRHEREMKKHEHHKGHEPKMKDMNTCKGRKK